MDRPLIVIDPEPRGLTEIFEPEVFARLQKLGRLEIHEGAGRMPAERLDALLPQAALLIGQSDMPRERLDRAGNLRAIINVETRTSITRPVSRAEFTSSRQVRPSPGPWRR